MVSIRSKAFSLLSRRAYFSKQLTRKLKEKGYPEEEIKDLIADFTKRGWLNDDELAKRFVERQTEKGYGPRVILMKLREKAGEIALEVDPSEGALRTLIKKKYARDLPEKRNKVIAALMRRGHPYDVITRLIDEE